MCKELSNLFNLIFFSFRLSNLNASIIYINYDIYFEMNFVQNYLVT